jgi:hypothetical protein
MSKIKSKLFILPALLIAGAAQAQAPAPGVGGPAAAITPEAVMANNDANKDGIITKEEATKAARNLAQRWDAFDANKDGKVDIEEVKKGLAAGAGPGGAPGAAPPAAAPPAATQPPAAR